MKRLKTVSNVLLIVLTLFTIFLFVYFGIKDGFMTRINILTYLIFLVAPKIINKIFKIKIRPIIEIMFYLYTFVALLLGGCMKFYRIVPNYDTMAHFIWGFLIAYFGLLLLMQFGKYDDNKRLFNITFFVSFSFMSGFVWEVIEFLCDQVLKTDMLRQASGVLDTMKDMVANALGTTLFVIWYLFIVYRNKVLVDKLKEGIFKKV